MVLVLDLPTPMYSKIYQQIVDIYNYLDYHEDRPCGLAYVSLAFFSPPGVAGVVPYTWQCQCCPLADGELRCFSPIVDLMDFIWYFTVILHVFYMSLQFI
jgi:hypothetical protein